MVKLVLTKRIQGFHPSLFVCELEYFRKTGQRYDRDSRRRDERKLVTNEPTVVTDKCNTHYTHNLSSLIKMRDGAESKTRPSNLPDINTNLN
jgi:hypothetical protein